MADIPEPCTLAVQQTDVLGAGCQNCGHSQLLHPMPWIGSPVTQCGQCEVMREMALLRQEILAEKDTS